MVTWKRVAVRKLIVTRKLLVTRLLVVMKESAGLVASDAGLFAEIVVQYQVSASLLVACFRGSWMLSIRSASLPRRSASLCRESGPFAILGRAIDRQSTR
jgi:hypothetical protein